MRFAEMRFEVLVVNPARLSLSRTAGSGDSERGHARMHARGCFQRRAVFDGSPCVDSDYCRYLHKCGTSVEVSGISQMHSLAIEVT